MNEGVASTTYPDSINHTRLESSEEGEEAKEHENRSLRRSLTSIILALSYTFSQRHIFFNIVP